MHGTASAPIIIEAASDGGAVIDGTNTGSTDHLLYVTNSSYVIFCGFELRNAHQSTFVIAGSGDSSSNGDNNNITVERVIAHDAGSGNWDCFAAEDNASGSSYASIRFVDDAGWGRCRYIFIAYHINGVVFQRDWARAAYTTNFSPAPRSSFGVYGSQNVTLENDIGLDTIPNTTDPNWYTAQWQTDNDTINFPTQNTTYLGDMFYNNCLGVYLTDTAGSGTVFRDTYIDVPANSTCQADQGSSYYYPIAVDWGDLFGGTMTNMAIVNSPYGYWGSSGTATITNSVFLNDGIALQGPFLQSYNDLYANGSNGVTLSATDSTASPGYNTSTYGRGAYLMPAPALIGKGNGGADIGAHIIYEYDNSSLTPTPLWPWPMESRIMADTGRSVTYASGGGIWNTLTGVYP